MNVLWLTFYILIFKVVESYDINSLQNVVRSKRKSNEHTEEMIKGAMKHFKDKNGKKHGDKSSKQNRQWEEIRKALTNSKVKVGNKEVNLQNFYNYLRQGDTLKNAETGQAFFDIVRREYEKYQREKNYIGTNPSIDLRDGFGDDDDDNKEHSDEKAEKSENDNDAEDALYINTNSDPNLKMSNAAVVASPKNCNPSVTHVKGKPKCKNQLIFSEDFQTIQKSRWTVEQKFAGPPDYEFVLYIDNPQTIEIGNGKNINIKPVLIEDVYGAYVITGELDLGENCTAKNQPKQCSMRSDAGFILPPVASALLSTKNKFSFRYGNIEIRAKLPAGDWIYPILYLNPVRELYGKNYDSGQIRIAFIEGNKPANKVLKAGIILGESDKARNFGMKNVTNTNSWSETFHTFQLQWTTDFIAVGVDGIEFGKIEPPEGGFASLSSELDILNAEDWNNGSLLAPFDKEMYLQVGVGVGGSNFEDRTDDSKPWRDKERMQVKKFYNAKEKWNSSWKNGKNSLQIDYIKIWAL